MKRTPAGGRRGRSARAAACLALLVAGAAGAAFFGPSIPRAAAEEVDAFARVVVERAEIRSGPGTSYRVIAALERGETVIVDRRGSDQFWLKLTLADGRTGWVLGDDVEVYAVRPGDTDKPSKPGLFAPPPLLGARGGLAILAGVLGSTVTSRDGGSFYNYSDGYFEIRPALVLSPTIALEPYAGISRTDDGSLTQVGGWAVIHLLPDVAVDPYFGLGGGYLWTATNADALAPSKDSLFVARAGGGLLFGLRSRILVRLEATNLTLFTPNRFKNMQTYVAGLGVYF